MYFLGFRGGFPDGPEDKNVGDPGSIPGSGKILWIKVMAAHSRILAWRIPWTEEPGRLQSMGSQNQKQPRN